MARPTSRFRHSKADAEQLAATLIRVPHSSSTCAKVTHHQELEEIYVLAPAA